MASRSTIQGPLRHFSMIGLQECMTFCSVSNRKESKSGPEKCSKTSQVKRDGGYRTALVYTPGLQSAKHNGYLQVLACALNEFMCWCKLP
mmetsp:Transcript_36131/g.87340  ORF Transcript_36131/g.87340 Transcript_36131/m.87340 type:complete len:90 (-) Transcript_36131:1297-1566(-)